MFGALRVLLQKLANQPSLWASFANIWTNQVAMRNCCQQQGKSYRNAQILLLHFAIVSYFAVWINQIIDTIKTRSGVSLCHCVID